VLDGTNINISSSATNSKFVSLLADVVGLQDAVDTVVATYTGELIF